MKGLLGYLIALVLGCLGLSTSVTAAPASTAPAGARDADSPAEPALSELNRHLAAYTAGARAALGEDGRGGAGSCLAQDQKRWDLEVRKACGTDEGCLRRITLERLAALDGLQPKASRITAFKLPEAPVLVTALPPSQDTAGQDTAGQDTGGQGTGGQDTGGVISGGLAAGGPFAVIGHLVHEREDAENMGLAIRSPAGRSAVLVPEMDIGNSPTHAALESAIRSDGGKPAGATYRVEGRLSPTGGFAMNQCRFVYRLPE